MKFHLSILVIALASLVFVPSCSPDPEPAGNNPGVDEYGLQITSPAPDSFVNRGRVRVRGLAEGIDEIEVEGQPVTVSAGEWEVLVDTTEGPSEVTARAGTQTASVSFFVDTVKPDLLLTEPARGTMRDVSQGDSIQVQGSARDDGSGIFAVRINGNIIDHDEEDGRFDYELFLREGLNVFSMSASDRAENELSQWRGLIYGPLTDPTEAINEALIVDVTPNGMDNLTAVIVAYATPERVLALLEEGFAEADLMITDLDWEDLQIEIDLRDGYLDIELAIEGLAIGGVYQPEDGEPLEGTIEVAAFSVNQAIAVSVGEENDLVVEVLSSAVDISASDVGGSLAESSIIRSLVAGAIAYAFTEFMTDLIEGNLYDPDVLVREFEFLDRKIEITLLLEDILISPLGVRVSLGLSFPADAFAELPQVPGALNRAPGPNTGSSVDEPFRLHTTRTTLDRVLHAVWRSGLFHQQIGGEDLDFELPFPLTADGLASLLDQRIRDIHEPDTPVGLGLRPLLPPVMELGDTIGDNSLTLDFGEVLIDVFLRPDEAEMTHLLTLALYLEVDLEVTFEGFEIGLDLSLRAESDIADEPVFAFDRQRVTNLITTLVTLIPGLVDTQFTIDGAADFEWASIGEPEIEVNGQDRDRVTLGLSISPAEDFIDDDELASEDGAQR